MIVVIQCAAGKRPERRHLVSTMQGKPVHFVASPEAAPFNPAVLYARPDDLAENGMSWRQILLEYNRDRERNPLDLHPAYWLYENRTYFNLVGKFTVKGVYILSAGWGLIPADFLMPYYDITFSPSADDYKRRKKSDRYQDFRMLPDDTKDDIVFFGGRDYLPLFCSLTSGVRSKRTIFYNSMQRPDVIGCTLKRFNTTTRTNWHYECANAFIAGEIDAA
jgi:hypothetical protein